MGRYQTVETEKHSKSYAARIWWALWAVAFVVLVYTAWTHVREFYLVKTGDCIVANYSVYNGEEIAHYRDEATNSYYTYYLSGMDAVHEEDTVKLYYKNGHIDDAEPHRDVMLWVKNYVIFGIAIILLSLKIKSIYSQEFDVYDVRETD